MTRAEIYARAKQNGALIDLSHRAKWIVNGADRVRFLNGQVSNDVRKLKPNGSAIHACVLTAKGKLCGDVFISARSNFLRLDVEPSLRESLVARLERYIIADDVIIEDITDKFLLFHIILPLGAHAQGSGDENAESFFRAQRFEFECEGVDLFALAEHFQVVWNDLAQRFQPIDAEMLETFRIEAGIPKWGAELDENTLPQEAGLERDAIDFHKGCYVGQEVISRIKSVGHVNRSLRGFVSDSPLFSGMEIFLSNEAAKAVGHLTSATWSFGLEKWAALGYLKRGVESPTASMLLEARAADGSAAAKITVKYLPLVQ
jgi:folate-binding protein YgfZ